MAEDILHDELGEGDKVLITHEDDEEELSFEIQKGEAEIVEEPDTDEESQTTNGEADVSAEDEVAEGESSDEEPSAATSDEEE